MLSGRAFDELEHSYTSNQLMLRHLSNELGSCQMLRVLLILCATFAGTLQCSHVDVDAFFTVTMEVQAKQTSCGAINDLGTS